MVDAVLQRDKGVDGLACQFVVDANDGCFRNRVLMDLSAHMQITHKSIKTYGVPAALLRFQQSTGDGQTR